MSYEKLKIWVFALLVAPAILLQTSSASTLDLSVFQVSWQDYQRFQRDNPITFSPHRDTVVVRINQRQLTFQQLVSFFADNYLSDAQKSHLFQNSGRDFDSYYQALTELLFENNGRLYHQALRDWSYHHLMRDHALSSRENSNQNRVAFTTTSQEFFEAMQNFERNFLASDLDRGLGIRAARDNFGAFLLENHFPHRSGENTQEVYWHWYQSHQRRIQHEILRSEVVRWEDFQSQRRGDFIAPTQTYRLYQQVRQTIENELNSQQMSAQQLQEYLAQNPQVLTLAQDSRAVSLATMEVSTLIELYQNHASIDPQQIIEQTNQQLLPYFNNFLSNILEYEQRSSVLFSRYQNEESPQNILTLLAEDFNTRSSDRDLMMARLYAMAAHHHWSQTDQHTHHQMRVRTHRALSGIIPQLMREMGQKLDSGDSFNSDEYQNMLYHQIINQAFSRLRTQALERVAQNLQLETNQQDQAFYHYLRSTLHMAQFLLRTHARNLTSQAPIYLDINVCDFQTRECFQKVEQLLAQQQRQENLEQFYTNELSRHIQTLNLRKYPTGVNLFDQEALNFLTQ